MRNLVRILSVAAVTAIGGNAYALKDCRLMQFDTQAHLEAANVPDCNLGYALDNDVLELRANGAWVGLSPTTTSITGANGGTIANGTNNHWILTENTENGDIVFSSDLVTFTSTTGATYAFTPAVAFAGAINANGGVDRSTAATLTIGGSNANAVAIVPATTVTGVINANGGVDRSTAAGLAIGAANATSVTITPNTTISGTSTLTGAAFANGGLDRSTAAALAIGASNATAVNITPATNVTGLTTTNGGLITGIFIDTSGSSLTTAKSGFLIVVAPGSDAVVTETLPAASTKANYCFAFDNGGTAGSTKELDIATPAGSDLIIGTTTAAGSSGIATTAGASHGIKNTHATAVRGNGVCLRADGTNTWYMFGISGTWAAF